MAAKNQQALSLRRTHRQMILLNDQEVNAFNKYCKKYKVKNKSKLIRDALFSKVLQAFEDDYPTLFDAQEMARMERRYEP